MRNNLQQSFLAIKSAIEKREYGQLASPALDIPDKFNWVRDIFEPLIEEPNPARNALELLSDDHPIPVTLTYREAREKCNQLLNFFRRQGIQPKDRMFMMCELHEGLWVSYLTAMKGGLVLIPAASILNVSDVVYRFEKAFPKIIIADRENVEKMELALIQYNQPVQVKLLLNGERDGWVSFSDIVAEAITAEAADTRKDDDLFWFFTSGTTGLPKVVVHTHTTYPLGHLTTAAWIGLKAGDKHYNIAQSGWAKFAWSSVFAPLNMGATIFAYKASGRFLARKQLQIIQDYKITTLCAPPTALRLLIQEKLNDYQFSLRECVSAGEPLNAEVIKIWKDGTGIDLRDGYGQTESTCMICNLPGSELKFGSMGKPAFLYDMVIADEHGNVMPVHETGQIAVRMQTGEFTGVFISYVGEEERQRAVFKYGLYYTGDKGYQDDAGYYWFVGRDDDVIKSSDYRVGPFEIESVLIEVAEILESAVVGSPHHIKGQEIKAFVVLTAGEPASVELANKVFAYCKSRLAPYKVPRIIEFIPELPKTISGKIRRIELRAEEEQHKALKEKREHEYFA